MANVINGIEETKYENKEVRKTLSNTTNNLACILWNGWNTRDTSYDLVRWRPREMNCTADYFANKCMNKKEAEKWTRNPTRISKGDSIHVFSDGGRRDQHLGSAAYVIYRIQPEKNQMIAHGAILLEDVHDSFEAEALALNAATEHLREILSINKYDTRGLWPVGTNFNTY